MQTEDPLVQCPYNQSHSILKSRMQAHLVKCKQNYPLAEKWVCPFNAIHHIDRPDYSYHVNTCPDRRVVEGHKYELEETFHGDIGLTPYHQPDLPPTDEDWDAETPVSAYDPSHHVEAAPVVRMLQGATKSQRKAFRLKERLRMQRLLDGEDTGSSSSSEPQPGPSTSSENMAPLRRPQQTSEALRLLNPSLGMGRGILSPGENNSRNSAPFSENFSLGFGRGAPLREEDNPIPMPIGIGRGRPMCTTVN